MGDIFGKDQPAPPPAPDYTGAAAATAAGNVDAARLATKANRVNQYTPYGALTYANNVGGDPDRWDSAITLTPTGQQLLDYDNASRLGLGSLTTGAMGRVSQGLEQPFDYGSVDDVYNKAYQTATSRLDDRFGRDQTSLETQLTNQGLRPGSEAWDNAMKSFNYGKNDAYQQAQGQAIATMPQTYQMAQALRSQPLNELNALRTGSQVQNPTFQTAPQQQTTPGANLLGAEQAAGQYNQGLYNAQVGQNNAMTSGLFSLGAAALGAPTGTFAAFSDVRLKSNIERVGTHPLGIGIYEYDIFDRRERGVMAHEVEQVKPEAVSVHESGFKMVDYAQLH